MPKIKHKRKTGGFPEMIRMKMLRKQLFDSIRVFSMPENIPFDYYFKGFLHFKHHKNIKG